MTEAKAQLVFVPEEYRAELDQLSKPELMDLAWHLAMYFEGSSEPAPATMTAIRASRDIVLEHHAKAAAQRRSPAAD